MSRETASKALLFLTLALEGGGLTDTLQESITQIQVTQAANTADVLLNVPVTPEREAMGRGEEASDQATVGFAMMGLGVVCCARWALCKSPSP